MTDEVARRVDAPGDLEVEEPADAMANWDSAELRARYANIDARMRRKLDLIRAGLNASQAICKKVKWRSKVSTAHNEEAVCRTGSVQGLHRNKEKQSALHSAKFEPFPNTDDKMYHVPPPDWKNDFGSGFTDPALFGIEKPRKASGYGTPIHYDTATLNTGCKWDWLPTSIPLETEKPRRDDMRFDSMIPPPPPPPLVCSSTTCKPSQPNDMSPCLEPVEQLDTLLHAWFEAGYALGVEHTKEEKDTHYDLGCAVSGFPKDLLKDDLLKNIPTRDSKYFELSRDCTCASPTTSKSCENIDLVRARPKRHI